MVSGILGSVDTVKGKEWILIALGMGSRNVAGRPGGDLLQVTRWCTESCSLNFCPVLSLGWVLPRKKSYMTLVFSAGGSQLSVRYKLPLKEKLFSRNPGSMSAHPSFRNIGLSGDLVSF